MTQHTILLFQENGKNQGSFSYHDTVALAVEELINRWENRLKTVNRDVQTITYEVKDLENYIDRMPDICALVYSESQLAYIPHDKIWIKNKMYNHLQRSLAKSQ